MKDELAPEFDVIRALGEGAVARVYLARETALGRLVAIKVPRSEIAQDATALRRFEREARSAAKLSHRNIVAVHRVGHLRDGTPYIVMQYADGRNLKDLLRLAGPLPESEGRTILLQLASALAEAHSKGIIHRDVRPGNVLWARETEQAVLMDFGLAGIVETGSEVHTRLTRAGQRVGDLEHMSPEQFATDPITPATDVYSLGVLGYELLAGRGPYRITSKAQLGMAHLTQPPESLSALRPDITPELSSLLENCLAKKPEHRPTAIDIVRVLSGPDAASGARHAPTGRGVAEHFPALGVFVEELRRRRVFNVGLLYCGVAFLLLQVAELIVPSLPLPDWSYDAVVALVLAGFPVTLVLTWIFEISGGEIRKTPPKDAGNPAVRRKQVLLQTIGVASSLLLAALIGWWVLSS